MERIVIDLPSIYCPIHLRAHPNEEQFQKKALAWMNSFGLLPSESHRTKVIETDSHSWIPRMALELEPSYDKIQFLVDYTYMAYITDDYLDVRENASMAEDMTMIPFDIISALEAPEQVSKESGHGRLVAAWADLGTRAQKFSIPFFNEIFLRGNKGWMLGELTEWIMTERAFKPSLQDWMKYRPSAGGAEVTIDALTLTIGEIPVVELSMPAVRALKKAALLIGEIDNDLFSHGREIWLHENGGRKKPPDTIVDILERQNGCSRAEAIEEAVTLRNTWMRFMLDLRDQLTPSASLPLRRYMTVLVNLIVRNLTCCATMGRYTNPDGDHPGAVTINYTITDTPPPEGPPALNIPGTDWWYDQLAKR